MLLPDALPLRLQDELAKRLLKPLGLPCLNHLAPIAVGVPYLPGTPPALPGLCTQIEGYRELMGVSRLHMAQALILAVLTVTAEDQAGLPMRVVCPPEPIVSWSRYLEGYKAREGLDPDASLKDEALQSATAEWVRPGLEMAVVKAVLGGAADPVKLRHATMRLSLAISNRGPSDE